MILLFLKQESRVTFYFCRDDGSKKVPSLLFVAVGGPSSQQEQLRPLYNNGENTAILVVVGGY